MLKTINSFGSFGINNSNYKVVGHNFNSSPAANLNFLGQAQADSVDSGAYEVEPRSNYLRIKVINYANRHALADVLRVQFKRGKLDNIISTFLDDGADYLLSCRVVSFVEDPDFPFVFTVMLQSGQTSWRSVNPDTASWTVTGLGGTKSFTVGGTDESILSVTITAVTSPAAGYLYQQLVRFVNVPGVAYPLRAWSITLNTAALVAAGKIQADCDDIALSLDGKIVRRFIIDPNTTTTQIIFLAALGRGFALTLDSTAQVETATAVGTITGSGNASVTVTADGLTGSPLLIPVAVTSGDIAATWAGKVRAALAANLAVTALFDVGGSSATITLTRNEPAANDSTLNIALANGSCTGITAAPTSANTATGTGDPLYLTFQNSATTKALIKLMPTQGIVWHGTEWISYSKTDAVNCRLTIKQHEAMGTIQQAHTSGDVFYYLQHVPVLYYGNTLATDPALKDTNYNIIKPANDLSNSSNSKRAWSATSLFYDRLRPTLVSNWRQFVKKNGNKSALYIIKGQAASGDPALGIKSAAYLKGTIATEDNVIMGWISPLEPGGIEKILSITGRKYRSGTKWPDTTAIQRSPDGTTWYDVVDEATPGSAGSFAAMTGMSNLDIDPTTKYLRVVIDGSSGAVKDSYQLLEVLTVSYQLTAANVPSITLLGERSNHTLDLRLQNNANGNAIDVAYPMQIGKPFKIDGEAHEITYHGINMHDALDLDDESRSVWVGTIAGAQTLQVISSTDVGQLTLALSAYRRRM